MAVEIDSIEKLIAFSQGEYGRGSSGDYLDVVLTKDLDFADYAEEYYSWPGCTGNWYINFDGKGHTINNIYYVGTSDWALFQYPQSSIIANLRLTNIYITTTNIVAGIGHEGYNNLIKNCHISGQLQGSSAIGMMAGGGDNEMRACSVSGKLIATSGGAIGISSPENQGRPSKIFNCMVNVDLLGTTWNAGICFNNHMVANSEFCGTISGVAGQNVIFGNAGGEHSCVIIRLKGCSPANALNNYNSNRCYSCFIDSTIAEAAGVVIPGVYSTATTEELQNDVWLKSKGFAI